MCSRVYDVVMRDNQGELTTSEILAKSPCRALVTATELFPEHEVLKISDHGEWS